MSSTVTETLPAVCLPSNGMNNIVLLLLVQGVVGRGSRGCESRGLWFEGRRSKVVGEGSWGSRGL